MTLVYAPLDRLIPAHAGKTWESAPTTPRARAHPRSRGENGRAQQLIGDSQRLIPAHAGKTNGYERSATHPRAHPRSRGENSYRYVVVPSNTGSSPLTRGKLSGKLRVVDASRLIPAHAGKTSSLQGYAQTHGAHPRSRGENVDGDEAVVYECGSSPLTRGKPHRRADQHRSARLIPAHAGKTRRGEKPLAAVGAHPRSRGENATSGTPSTAWCGSSPLTRGKRDNHRPTLRDRRLIPAHAGKTISRYAGRHDVAAHPRSRGENVFLDDTPVFGGGSSPLTRGKRVRGAVNVDDTGLIPAHAGKTICLGTTRSVAWAHPRSRGENKDLGHMKYLTSGSSPLTRGKLNRRDKPLATAGLIPAHAGKTRRFRSRLATLPGSSPLTRGKLVHGLLNGDRGRLIPAHAGKTSGRITVCHAFPAHPRSRGENVLMSLGLWARSGSSPLTRGKLRSLTRSSLTGRLIPAHAGKTDSSCHSVRSNAAHPRSRGENEAHCLVPSGVYGSSPLTRGKP